jgi:serine/threonine protein kinase, bacterial
VLIAAGRIAVEAAISKLYTERDVHLWVAYLNDFSGLTPTPSSAPRAAGLKPP